MRDEQSDESEEKLTFSAPFLRSSFVPPLVGPQVPSFGIFSSGSAIGRMAQQRQEQLEGKQLEGKQLEGGIHMRSWRCEAKSESKENAWENGKAWKSNSWASAFGSFERVSLGER